MFSDWNQCCGSGSVITRYGSGSVPGSRVFYHRAKIVKKTSFYYCDFFLTFYLDVKVALKSNKQKFEKNNIFVAILKDTDENSRIRSGSGSVSQKSTDPLIQICTKIFQIRNTDKNKNYQFEIRITSILLSCTQNRPSKDLKIMLWNMKVFGSQARNR